MEEHPQARFIVETLHKAGFIAYYAGGWVRDFLLNHPSDDIDIATSAPPQTIQILFPHTVPIGIAFGIVLVLIEGHQYEVATFRRDLAYHDGRRPTEIEFSEPEEDARRRDFTINGMFYNPLTEEILDYVGGKEDLKAGIIRAIGNPHERIKEDRLRMIRAVRIACRLRFTIELKTAEAIRAHNRELFPPVAVERIVQEFAKGQAFGILRKMLIRLHEFDLLTPLFPELANIPNEEISQRLEPLSRYPKTAPLIAFLLPLFPQFSLDEQLALCKRLKLSNQELNFVTFLFRARELIDADLNQIRLIEPVEWAYFYGHAACATCLQVISSHLDLERQTSFLKSHEERMDTLKKAIERVRDHNPIVKGDDLQREGVKPGKTMGILLVEAERICFNEGVYDPALVIERLKNLEIWPT